MSDEIRIRFCRPTARMPARATAGSAGYDLTAAIDVPLELAPGARALVPTGIELALPAHLEAQVRPRSGLALKHGIMLPNAPGTIDADYRGEVGVILANIGDATFIVEPGMRIAQLVFAAVCHPELVPVTALPASDRGAGGFGHSGV